MPASTNNVPKEKAGFFYGYWILLVCFLFQFIKDGASFYSFGLYVKPLTSEFNWSRGLIMGASTATALAMGLSSPFVGSLVQRFGAKRVMAGGAVFLALIFVLLSLVKSVWQFYILETALGLAAGASGVIPASMLIGRWFKKRLGFAIGVLGTGIGAGGFVMPRLIGVYLIPNLGWRNTMLITGILMGSVLTPLALLVIKPDPREMGFHPDGIDSPDAGDSGGDDARDTEEGPSAREARRSLAFWLMALAFTTFGFANTAIFSNHIPYLEDIGFSTAIAAGAFSFVGIGSAIGKFGFGWLCDFIPAKFTLVIGIICQLISVILLLGVKQTSPQVVLWLASFAFGLGIGCWLPALTMTVRSVFGMTAYGAIFGMMNLIFIVGGAAGPVVAGFIYDLNHSYFWAFIVALVLYAVALPSILMVRRPGKAKGLE